MMTWRRSLPQSHRRLICISRIFVFSQMHEQLCFSSQNTIYDILKVENMNLLDLHTSAKLSVSAYRKSDVEEVSDTSSVFIFYLLLECARWAGDLFIC
jgi:hypothetical protein